MDARPFDDIMQAAESCCGTATVAESIGQEAMANRLTGACLALTWAMGGNDESFADFWRRANDLPPASPLN